MRKEYGKALRALFTAEMRRIAPHFKEVKVTSMSFWPGDRAFRWQPTNGLDCWIVLSPSKKDDDAFTVLLGWSKQGRYPDLSMVPCEQRSSPGRDEFAHREYLTRLPYLVAQEDRWWVIEEFRAPRSVADIEAKLAPIPAAKAKQAVTPVVQEAVSQLETVGLPYLEEFSRFVEGTGG